METLEYHPMMLYTLYIEEGTTCARRNAVVRYQFGIVLLIHVNILLRNGDRVIPRLMSRDLTGQTHFKPLHAEPLWKRVLHCKGGKLVPSSVYLCVEL